MDNYQNALIKIKNAEDAGKDEVVVRPASSLLLKTLEILQKHGYIGEYEYIDDGRDGVVKVKLVGRINDLKAIRPRFPVKKDEYTKWEQRFLPARGIGLLIVSTPHGLMTQEQAKALGTGGRLVAYVW